MRYPSFLFIVILLFSLAGHKSFAQYGAKHKPDSFVAASFLQTKAFKKIVAAPIALTLVGLYSTLDNDLLNKYDIRAERNEEFYSFKCNADDYLQYAPIVAVYGLNLMGVKGEHDFRNRTALLIKTELLVGALSWSLKTITAVPRPDTQQPNSFPSGHTAQAFAAATILHKEYGGQSIWYSIGAYSVATSVGVLRVLNNRHWVSDVLVGAGVGILSTNIIYATHKNLSRHKNKKDKVLILPTVGSSSGFYLSYRL